MLTHIFEDQHKRGAVARSDLKAVKNKFIDPVAVVGERGAQDKPSQTKSHLFGEFTFFSFLRARLWPVAVRAQQILNKKRFLGNAKLKTPAK